jgi:2-methylaconitate cis-trans-isomerase PrpF
MSSAVGPFVVDEGLLPAKGDRAVVRIHNTNTGKIIRSTFPLDPISGHAAVRGDLIIPGINGSGAPVQLDFLDPGGARTGRLLPTSNASDLFDVPAIGLVEMSLVDAANPVVFVEAEKLGLTGLESPTSLEADNVMMQRLHAIGAFAGTHLNIVEDNAAGKNSLPLIASIAPPRKSISLDGEEIAADEGDLVVRMLSSGQPHRALPVTGAICTAVAMQIAGTIPNRLARSGQGIRRLAMPSGVIQVDAHVVDGAAGPSATSGTIFRTARRLFEGFVYY